jgi:predicted transcriptional regulator of viral defense system
MKFDELLRIVEEEPVFSTRLLMAGAVRPAEIYPQLSYWEKTGRILQLRRGLYVLAPPYQKTQPHPFSVANAMVPGSYVSCQSALAHTGLIPEWVPMITSVSTGRPGIWKTPLGEYWFRHIREGLFFGYHRIEVMTGRHAFVARPEKALLDLIHLQPEGDSHEYLTELRLQNLDRFDLDTFSGMVERGDRPKLRRALTVVEHLCAEQAGESKFTEPDTGSDRVNE